VISRMIDSMKNNPEDMRKVIYDLARYKLREQLPHANAEEKQRTQQALETAIRGVETFSEKRIHIHPLGFQSQLNGPGAPSTDRRLSSPEWVTQARSRSRSNVDSLRNTSGPEHTHTSWLRHRRTAAMIASL